MISEEDENQSISGISVEKSGIVKVTLGIRRRAVALNDPDGGGAGHCRGTL